MYIFISDYIRLLKYSLKYCDNQVVRTCIRDNCGCTHMATVIIASRLIYTLTLGTCIAVDSSIMNTEDKRYSVCSSLMIKFISLVSKLTTSDWNNECRNWVNFSRLRSWFNKFYCVVNALLLDKLGLSIVVSLRINDSLDKFISIYKIILALHEILHFKSSLRMIRNIKFEFITNLGNPFFLFVFYLWMNEPWCNSKYKIWVHR